MRPKLGKPTLQGFLRELYVTPSFETKSYESGMRTSKSTASARCGTN
jgi:hypothetical protein